MKKNQYIYFAIYVGIQSFLLQLLDKMISPHLLPKDNSGFVFLAFQGWALYFLLGSNIKAAIKGFCGYFIGICFSIIMILLSNIFSSLGILAVPLAALITVPFMMYFEFAPWFMSVVATFFIGAGAFFAIITYVEGISIPIASFTVLLYCLLGLASGYATIKARTWYENRLLIRR